MIIVIVTEDALYICICNAVTERQLKECARSGARSLEDVAFQLGVGTGCGRCRECASGVLREVHADCNCALAGGE
jgi:bacterioferritin-associated ferredoxin